MMHDIRARLERLERVSSSRRVTIWDALCGVADYKDLDESSKQILHQMTLAAERDPPDTIEEKIQEMERIAVERNRAVSLPPDLSTSEPTPA